MLNEIVELAKIAKEIVSSSRAKVSGWRQFLRLYHTLDDVSDASDIVLDHYFLVPLDVPFLIGTRSYKSPLGKWVSVTNDDFKELDQAVVAFIKCYDQLACLLEVYDSNLIKRINYHFGVKSWWCGIVGEAYCSGRISSDGRTLHKTAIRLAQAIPSSRYGRDVCGGDAAKALTTKEAIDISDSQVKQYLVEKGRKNVEALRGIKTDLAAFIRSHCKIEDLM